MMKQNKKIAIIGSGPSCLKAAFNLSPYFKITIFEKQKSIGQKFLVAGKGGFNLTNSVDHTLLKSYYSPLSFLDKALDKFTSNDTRNWLKSLGIETFIGSGNKVLAEKKHKPINVLNTIKSTLIKNDVKIITNAKLDSIYEEHIIVNINGIKEKIYADYFIFGLGGASWKVTGTDGLWTKAFNQIGIRTNSFEPSNCGVNILWPKQIRENHAGKPIKNIKINCGNIEKYGEATVTEYGLEGNAIYPLIKEIRESLNNNKTTEITIDFKPDVTFDKLFKKLLTVTSKEYGKSINLSRVEMAVLKAFTSKDEFVNPELFVQKIKKLTIAVNSLRPIDEAISSVGGIPIEELNNDFSLKKYPNMFTIGEMVNWDAPTGGFLLQACFSMGTYVADKIIQTKFLGD